MNKTEITSLVRSEIKKFVDNDLDVETKKRINKKNSQTRDELIKLISDSIENVYKVLWQKRDFWKKDIK